jgi:SPP1 gp7 family putative phage head morphogenesis protein
MPEQEGEIYDVVERFRRTLLQRERHAASKMVRVYGEIWQRIKREYDDLKKELFETEGENKDVLAWKLMRAGKLKQFIENELARFSVYADESIVEQQREAIEAAEAHAQELILKSLGEVPHGITIDLYQPNRSAVEKMVGMTQPDSPLHRLLAGIAPQAAEAAGNVLVQGIILGKNPYDVAVDLRKVLGEALSRALRIARTEVLRAYREATRETYRANADVVKGWIWHSACDDHTCVACWVMHGTHHSLDERLDDHPNGRCSALPLTKSWEEIGKQYGIDLSDVPDTNPDVKQGVLLFNRFREI